MSSPREDKKRALFFGNVGGYEVTGTTPSPSRFTPVQGCQRTISYNWPSFKAAQTIMRAAGKMKRPYFDAGHSFYTRKDWYEGGDYFNGRLFTRAGVNFYYYGNALASKPNWDFAAVKAQQSSDTSLDAFGTHAIAVVRPTKPVFDSAVSIAELLREGLPKMAGSALLKSRLKDYRKVGDEYLNYQFGIAPIVSSIQDGVKTALQAEKLYAQIERDNGRVIRRSFVDDPVKTIEEIQVPYQQPLAGTTNVYLVGTPRNLTRTIETTRQRWFKGAFTYYLPPNDKDSSFFREAKKAEMVFGARLNAEVLYNLLPWSWALDWVTNTGDIIANITAFSQEGLVMRYGYVMETTSVRITDTISVPSSTGFGRSVLSHSYGTTIKVRRRATPYGFGLNEKSFTDYQWGIIGALGISNAPKRLR